MDRLLASIRQLTGTNERREREPRELDAMEHQQSSPERTTADLRSFAGRLNEGLQSRTERVTDDPASSAARMTGEQRPSGGLLKKALLFLGVITAAYAASRYRRSGDVAPDEELSAGTPSEDPFSEETLSEEEPSTEEIEARTEEDVTEEPAEPGEMNVDEDVVDDIVDEVSEDEERT